MDLIRKQYPITLEAKAADDGDAAGLGTFSGIASVYNVIDLHGDVITPGAFDRTLQEKGEFFPLLWQHYIDQPIGRAAMRADAQGLQIVQGEPNADVEKAREAMSLVRQGAIGGISIGFNIVADRIEKGIRYIDEVDLWEVSIVTFAAQPLAKVTHADEAPAALLTLKQTARNDRKKDSPHDGANDGVEAIKRIDAIIDLARQLRA